MVAGVTASSANQPCITAKVRASRDSEMIGSVARSRGRTLFRSPSSAGAPTHTKFIAPIGTSFVSGSSTGPPTTAISIKPRSSLLSRFVFSRDPQPRRFGDDTLSVREQLATFERQRDGTANALKQQHVELALEFANP